MDLKPFELEILRDLYKSSSWLDLYIFHERYRLSPGQISFTIRNFQKLNVIQKENDFLRLTEAGRQWVFLNRKSIFLKRKKRFWADRSMPIEPLTPTTPYMPRLSRIKLRFFENYS